MHYFLIQIMVVFTSLNTLLAHSIDGELNISYHNIEKENTEKAYATSIGGFLKYTSETKDSFFASIRFDTSNPAGHNQNKIDTNLFNNDENANSLTANSEAFLAYNKNNRTIRLGNIMLNTPMMNDDTTRIVPWSYQGFTYTDLLAEDIKIQLYYINKIRSFTSPTYKTKSASGEIEDDGISILSLHYNNNDNLKVQSYYYYAPKLYSTFTLQTDYQHIKTDTTLLCFGIQYFNSGNSGEYADRYNLYGGDDINLIAMRVLLDSDDYTLSLNYSQNFGLSGIMKGYGGLTKTYTTSMVSNGRANYKPETWMLKTLYYLPNTSHNTELALHLTNTIVHDNRGDGFNSYYLHIKQYFRENSNLHLRYEKQNFTTFKNNAAYFRLIAQYEF